MRLGAIIGYVRGTMSLGAIFGYVRGTRDCIRGAVHHLPPLPSPPSLGLAYAGSAREDVIQLLTPVLLDPSSSLEVCVAMVMIPVPSSQQAPPPTRGSLLWYGGCGQLP